MAVPMISGRRPALARRLAERVEEEAEPQRRQHETGEVEPFPGSLPVLGQLQGAEGDRRHPDGHVDEEHPSPGEVIDEGASDERAERRSHDGGDHQEPGHTGALGRRKRPVQHRHPDRRQHAAADPLEHPEDDQLEDRLGQAAQHRCDREQGDRREEGALGAETVPDPAGRGNPHREAHEIADHHPVGRRRAHPEISRDGGERDVDDRRIHDRHEHRHDVDRPDDLLGAQPHRAHLTILAQGPRSVRCGGRDTGGGFGSHLPG